MQQNMPQQLLPVHFAKIMNKTTSKSSEPTITMGMMIDPVLTEVLLYP